MRLVLALFFLFSISLFAQNFFPIKTGDKFQFRVIESHDEPGYSWEHTTFNKSIVTEVYNLGKIYYLYKDKLLRYDSLNLKLFILINNSEKLAYDFNKQANETDTLYITGAARLFTYQADSYINLWGANRLLKKATWTYQSTGTEIGEIQIVEDLGIFKVNEYNMLGSVYDVTKDLLISAIIDSSIYNPLTVSVTATFPSCISIANNQFTVPCNIITQYLALIDTLKAVVTINSEGTVLYTEEFFSDAIFEQIFIDLPTALLVPPNSVNIQIICKDKSIFENTAYFPDTGSVNIQCQNGCYSWSNQFVSGFLQNWYYLSAMKFFNKDIGNIFTQWGNHDNPVWQTNDGGFNWIKSASFPKFYKDKNFQMIDSQYTFCLNQSNSIIKTIDGGNNLNEIYYRQGNQNHSISFINRNEGWVAVDYQESSTTSYPAILKTTNSGNSWDVIQVNLGSQLNEIDFVSENAGWLQTINGNFYKSIDGGINWNQISSIPQYNIVYMKDTLTGWAIGSGVARTSDGGFTWMKLLSGNYWDAVFFNANHGWVLGMDSLNQSAIFYTIDAGTSWVRKDFGILSANLFIDFIDKYHGWILFYDGTLLRTVNSGITFMSEEEPEHPNDFYISQNYPNPFNPITIIRYEIPTRSNVNISVFNILGKMVSVLVNEVQYPNEYEIKFDASLLPSGVYIYRITAENYSRSQKMILLK